MDAYPHLNALYLSSRLQARLEAAAGYPVTTIVAPTGYGKTTAAQDLRQRIAAEAPDAHVFRQFLSGGGRQEFWTGLCRALHTAPQLAAQLPDWATYPVLAPMTLIPPVSLSSMRRKNQLERICPSGCSGVGAVS